ncbi:hypothetical protein [Acetobacterium malicum]|uniref:hypothetical protein n=1 Tax=Acetobacterium malicum TaxID=52692 RepID=UPI0004267134|nr:hypothetical protein [Acetobacterium dehalogenans]
MNEFIKESFELEKKKELAKQIAILCLEINSIGDERKSKQGKPCVFLNLSGHVGNIDVAINEKGWESKRRPDIMFRLNEYSPLSEFTDCLAYLNELYLSQTMESETEKNGDEEGKELSVDIDQAVGA